MRKYNSLEQNFLLTAIRRRQTNVPAHYGDANVWGCVDYMEYRVSLGGTFIVISPSHIRMARSTCVDSLGNGFSYLLSLMVLKVSGVSLCQYVWFHVYHISSLVLLIDDSESYLEVMQTTVDCWNVHVTYWGGRSKVKNVHDVPYICSSIGQVRKYQKHKNIYCNWIKQSKWDRTKTDRCSKKGSTACSVHDRPS